MKFDARTLLPIGVVGLGIAWFLLAIVDRLAGTTFLATVGFSIASGRVEVSRPLFLLFYVATLAAPVAALVLLRLRRNVFGVPTEGTPADGDRTTHLTEPRKLGRWEAGVLWAVAVAANILILGIRFLVFPWPQGSDTPLYVQATNAVVYRSDLTALLPLAGLGVGRSLTIAAVVGLRLLLDAFLGNAELVTVIVLPVLLGVVYSVAVYAFVQFTLENRRLALWGAVLAPASLMTIRLSYELFAQFLGQALGIAALGAFAAYLMGRRARPPLVSGLFVLAFLAHFWTWAIFAAIALGLAGSRVIAMRERRTAIARAAFALLPSIALASLYIVVASSIRAATVYPYSVGDAHPFSFAKAWYWLGGWESAMVWIFATVGFAAALRGPPNPLRKLPILLWTSTLSALIFVAGYNQSFRFMIMYPVPVLIALGLDDVRSRLRRIAHSLNDLVRRLRPSQLVAASEPHPKYQSVAVAAGLTLILIGSVIPVTYAAVWTNWLGSASYQELVAIRDAYGFGNASVVLLIEPAHYERGLYWASAITGVRTYPGYLLSLLRGDPYREDVGIWTPFPLGGVREILAPRTLYAPDSFEQRLLGPSKVPTVRSYSSATGYDPRTFTTNASLSLAASFWRGWTLHGRSFSNTFSNQSSHVMWTLEAQTPREEVRWVSYDRLLPAARAESLYLVSAGSLGGARGTVEVYYDDGTSTSFRFDGVWHDPTIARVALQPLTLERVRVVFWIDPGDATVAGWFEISFMALWIG